jgi:hypothetical protein
MEHLFKIAVIFVVKFIVIIATINLFAYVFTIGVSPENKEVIEAIGYAVGVAVFMIVDQCTLKHILK